MRIWRFADPRDYRFAQASRRGSWSPSSGVCLECSASGQRRIQPLILEWEPGSNLVGDFTFVGFDADIVVTQRVAEGLKKFGGFEVVPIEMVEDPKAQERDRVRRRKPRVSLPYEGPNLFELWITQIVPLDLTRSSVRLTKECGTCGQRQYEVDGTESVQLTWDSERSEYVTLRKSRERGHGLFIAEPTLGTAAIFRVREFPGWVLCTEPVKQFVTQAGFTNVAFLEIGEAF